MELRRPFLVAPAKAGVHFADAAMSLAVQWIPAFAGMTTEGMAPSELQSRNSFASTCARMTGSLRPPPADPSPTSAGE